MDFSLKKYNFDEVYGFVEKYPVQNLPDRFRAWETIAANLEKLRRKPNGIFDAVKSLPLIPIDGKLDRQELFLAHTILSCIGMSYIHENPEKPRNVLPKQIAIPWNEVSKKIGLPPIIVHMTASLNNYKMIHKYKGIEGFFLENLKLIYSLDDSRDLEVFMIIPLIIELQSVQAIKALGRAKKALVHEKDHESKKTMLISCLTEVEESLVKMTESLKRMSPGCRPEFFYSKHRPLLSGWKNNPLLPGGILYEGVGTFEYCGGSAAQSPSIQIIDAGLDVTHPGSEGNFLRAMRKHMLSNHEELILDMAKPPSIREYCEKTEDSKLERSYNSALESLEKFRSQHLVLAARYIIIPSTRLREQNKNNDDILNASDALLKSSKETANQMSENTGVGQPKHLEDEGTGGTPLSTFLKNVRSHVKSSLI